MAHAFGGVSALGRVATTGACLGHSIALLMLVSNRPGGFFARSDELTCDEGCDGGCDDGCGGLATSCDESCDAGCDECSYDESCDSHRDTCTDAVCPEGMHGAQSQSLVASAPLTRLAEPPLRAWPAPPHPACTLCYTLRLRHREGLHEQRLARVGVRLLAANAAEPVCRCSPV